MDYIYHTQGRAGLGFYLASTITELFTAGVMKKYFFAEKYSWLIRLNSLQINI